MSADLLRPNPRPGPRPAARPARVRVPSSAPLSSRPSSSASDSGSSVSSASSTGSHRNKALLKTYHDFAMQIFNPGHAQDVENLFLAAARDGDFERVENFLRRRSHEIVNIDVKEKRTGNTPILWAAKNGHVKIVQLLLKYGADITIRNFDNETAIDVAKPGVRAVLLQSVERAGCSPRHLLQAAWQGNIQVVQRLLNESKVLDINCRNADGYTPLLLVTRDVDLFEQIGAALENYNPQAVVKELLHHRADLTTHDAEGRTPLHFAAASKAKISEEIALILMSEPAILEMRDRRSLAPIHSASQSGQVEILVALLDSGADVNARGYAGATPLHISAYSGQLQAATKLLNHGADVTLVDDSGNTPVDVAKTKKLKHTLREAWTEATQAKRDMVLTPVKPPSRMAESRGPSTEERAAQESLGSTPRPGSSMTCTPEKRIIRKMTEAHKAVLAEEQMLRDIDCGRFTPSNTPRKLGLPRASSRNSTSPGKIPVPPKTPRVLDHAMSTTTGTSPDKPKKASRSLFGGRPRTHTVPGGEGTTEIRNQRARAHAKVAQRNSDPVTSKPATDIPQVPVTVVGLDLDENLRDISQAQAQSHSGMQPRQGLSMSGAGFQQTIWYPAELEPWSATQGQRRQLGQQFQRLVSGPVAPFLERQRSHERVDALVNPTPPSERKPSAGKREPNPSIQDLTGACIEVIRKGLKYQRSVSSSSSTASMEKESGTSPPKRVSFRANVQTHPLNLEQMHLRLGTPSPMLEPVQLFNPTTRQVMPFSPSHYSDNLQETIFEFDDEEEQNDDGQSHGRSQTVDWKEEHKLDGTLTLTRTKSILDHSKPFSIENTRVTNPSKEVSTDSGQGSRTTDSVASSLSTLSTPSPLLLRTEGDSHFLKRPITNRLGVNMTPSATTVKEVAVKTTNPDMVSNNEKRNASARKMDTRATTEISLHSAKTLVVENAGAVSVSVGKQQQPNRTFEAEGKIVSRTSAPNSENVKGKSSSVSSSSSASSASGRVNNGRKVGPGAKLENTAVSKQIDLESKRTTHKRQLSSEATVSHPAKEAKATKAIDDKKHETVDDSQMEKESDCAIVNKVTHETAVVNQPVKQSDSVRKPVVKQTDSYSKVIQGSNSIQLNSNVKASSSPGNSHSSSRKTITEETPVHQTAVDKMDSQVKPSDESGPTCASTTDTPVNQCKTTETKLLFGRLTGQGSIKKSMDSKPVPGVRKSDTKSSSIKTSVESLKRSTTTSMSQEGSLRTSRLPSQGTKQGKSSVPPKAAAQKADTPTRKMDSLSVSSEMPKVSPRPGYNQGSKSPAGSTERVSPRIQTSKGGPSLSKSFGSGSSQTKTEIRNMVRGVRQSRNKVTASSRQPCSSDEGVGLEMEEQADKLRTSTSNDKNTSSNQQIILDPQHAELQPKQVESHSQLAVKSTASKAKVTTDSPSNKTTAQERTGVKKSSKEIARPQSGASKSDSVESVEDVYEAVVFISDDEKGEGKDGKSVTVLSQDAVTVQFKEADEEGKTPKQKKVVGKAGGRIVPTAKAQTKNELKDGMGGLSKSALKAVGKSVSEAKSKGTKPTAELPAVQPFKKTEKLPADSPTTNEESGKTSESLSPKSPGMPNPKTSKFHWSKFKSPDLSPRSDSSLEAPHDPRVIKEHTPVIQDVMELMQMMNRQTNLSPIPFKPRQKISSTSSCPNPSRPSTLVKIRRRAASTKEPLRKPSMKGSLRKVAIMGQSAQKGKAGRPGSGGKSRQKNKKKRETDAVSTQKGKARTLVKPNAGNRVKQGDLHSLSESDSATKAFITGQGWHIQTEKNETSDVIVHDRSALDSSSDATSDPESPVAVNGSPKLSPHNTLMLNELCKIHPLSPAVINNIANIISPLEVDTPRYIPDTMGAIKEFGDSLKSNSSSETDHQSQSSAKRRFTFGESSGVVRSESGNHQEKSLDNKEIVQQEADKGLTNQSLDPAAEVKPEKTEGDKESSSGSESAAAPEKCEDHRRDGSIQEDNASVTNTPRIITSALSGNTTERSDASFGMGEDVSSYETNPEFLRVFRLQDPPTPRMSPGSAMLTAELGEKGTDIENKENIKDQTALPDPSTGQEPDRNPTSLKVSHKPPLPSKINTAISELTRVPRGSIKRRHSEPPAKVSEENHEAAEKAEDSGRVIKVKNSWKDEAELQKPQQVFAEDQELRVRSRWRERSQVEDMVSPLKSRLPDKTFSPPSSSKDSPTRKRGNSMPEVMNKAGQVEEQRNRKKSSEEALDSSPSADQPSLRKVSNYSEGSEVFLHDVPAADDDDEDDEDDAALHDKEQILTEHVQHMSMNAIQELNTVLSQTGDFQFEFPSPTLRPQSREADAESIALDQEASDWLNQSLAASEASEGMSQTLSAMRNYASDSSEMINTHSSGLSSERSHSSSTNFSEPEGGLLHWKKGNILGRGAFGVVYCGLTNTGQLIAVKQVELSDKDNKHKSRKQYEKLQEEVELLKTLRHRNIVGFLGVSLEGSTVNIFMQYIPGGSIASLLARFGALEEPVFCRYTKQILQGTEYLHAKNVIHRDIKGANIMLMSNGVIKLIDFGCAKRLCINISQSQNLLKSMRGTPYWMAPEVIMETGHGKKSDIWSIGCTVFEMATRKPPWAEMPPMTAIFAIGSGGPVPQLPERFSCFAREFVNACLTRDQDERPTATQLLTHSFIRKRRERGRDRFETRISSSTMEDANITFKEQLGSEVNGQEKERRSRRQDHFS